MLRTVTNSLVRLTFKPVNLSKCRPPPSNYLVENRPFSTCSVLFKFDPDAFMNEDETYGKIKKDFRSNNKNWEDTEISETNWNDNELSSRNRNFDEIQLPKQKWDELLLPEIKKKVSKETSEKSNKDFDVEKFRTENRISIVQSTCDVPDPISGFGELSIPEKLKDRLKRSGFETPMPIQAQGWPIVMSGSDLIGIGETGSGKTLGFLLPAFQHILEQENTSRLRGPQVLILSPTRELAQQTEAVAKKFGSSCGLFTVSVYGGASRQVQINQLRNKCDIVVGTPGRMIDLLECGGTHLERCTYVVLDEADRMLDMGFEPQIRQILEQVRPDRQMMMWSATWPKEVRDLAKDFFGKGKPLIHMNIGSAELQANPNIEQVIEVTETNNDKKTKVLEFLEEVPQGERVLIFVATKRTADFLEQILYREKFRAIAIHGGKSQAGRDRALYDFRNGKRNIMVATDVASRGLDVDDIKLVINFDMPTNIEDYIHRIGRTGRRGRQGKAVSMLERSEASKKLVRDLIDVLKEAKQEVPSDLLDLQYSATFESSNSRYGRSGGYNRPNNNFRRYNSDQYGERRYNSNQYGENQRFGGYNRSFTPRDGGYNRSFTPRDPNSHRSSHFKNPYERSIDGEDDRYHHFDNQRDSSRQHFDNRRDSNRGPRTRNVFSEEDDEMYTPRNPRENYKKSQNSNNSASDIYDTVLSNLKRD